MNAKSLFHLGVRVGVVLTLTVIILGAFVRLSDAGLGCPDWPGCYGRLLAPTQAAHIDLANQAFPDRPVEVRKAWKEMVHRYAAGSLGLVVLMLALLAWRARRDPGQPVALPFALLGLIIFQSALGMWTVTLQLKPVIVMGHLLGGFATLVLLWLLLLATRARGPGHAPGRARGGVPALHRRVQPWASVAAAVLVLQIALGGWTSANYAALACPDFPQCQQQWWPRMDFRDGFVLWRGTGVDYEFGVLDAPARTAIHFTHRIGAVVTLLAVGGLALLLMWRGRGAVRGVAAAVMALLLVQISLGISNIVFYLPLPVATAHNAVAALLLLSMVTLLHVLRQPVAHTVRAPGRLRVAVNAGRAV
jgi:heme a synthase